MSYSLNYNEKILVRNSGKYFFIYKIFHFLAYYLFTKLNSFATISLTKIFWGLTIMNIRVLTYIALFAAIMGVMGLMPPIPLGFTPVPVTLQTLGVMLAGSILGARLGPKYAAYSMILFLLLVAAGMPLLSGGRGGLGSFVTPSGGYLIGWVAGAYVIGYICYKVKEMSLYKLILANIVGGILVIYLFGIPVQAFMMDIPIGETIILSLAFLPGDLTKVMIGSLLAVKLQQAIPQLKEA